MSGRLGILADGGIVLRLGLFMLALDRRSERYTVIADYLLAGSQVPGSARRDMMVEK